MLFSLQLSVAIGSFLVASTPQYGGYEIPDPPYDPKCTSFSLQTQAGAGPFLGYCASGNANWIDKAGDDTIFKAVKEGANYRLQLKNGQYLNLCPSSKKVNFKPTPEDSAVFTFLQAGGNDIVYLKNTAQNKFISGGQKGTQYAIRPTDIKTDCGKFKIVCADVNSLVPFKPICEQLSIKGKGGYLIAKGDTFSVTSEDSLNSEFIAIPEGEKYRLKLRPKTTEERWLNFCDKTGQVNIKDKKVDTGIFTFWKCSVSGTIYIKGGDKYLSIGSTCTQSAEKTEQCKLEVICHGVSPRCNSFRLKTWENNFLGPDQTKQLFVPKNQCCPSEFINLETTDFKSFGLKFPAGYLDFCTSNGNPAKVKPVAGQFTFERIASGKYKIKQKDLYLSGGQLSNLQQYGVRGKPAPTQNCEEFEIICGDAC